MKGIGAIVAPNLLYWVRAPQAPTHKSFAEIGNALFFGFVLRYGF